MSFLDISYGVWVAAAVAVVVAIKLLRKSPPKPSVAELRRKYGQLDFGVKVPKGTKAEEPSVLKAPPLPEPELAEQMELDAVVVGGSFAGLASAAALQRQGVSYIAFERDPLPGLSWAKRYNRLHLHTLKTVSNLPYYPLPASCPLFPSRNEVAQYLYDYAKNLKLKVCFNSSVSQASFDAKSNTWTVKATVKKAGSDKARNVTVKCKELIICTGKNPQNAPRIPKFKNMDKFQGKVMHSSVFGDGEELRGKRVLVVGFGNSAGEIAVDLWEHDAKPTILSRGSIACMPRSFVEFMQSNPPPAFLDGGRKLPNGVNAFVYKLLKLIFYRDVSKYGLQIDNSKCAEVMRAKKHPPLIDVGTVDLIRKGEVGIVHANIDSFTEDGVVLDNGKKLQFDACILCTGFLETGGFEQFLDDKVLAAVRSAQSAYFPNAYSSTLGGNGIVNPGHKQLYFVGFNDFLGLIDEIAREVPQMAANVKKDLAQLK